MYNTAHCYKKKYSTTSTFRYGIHPCNTPPLYIQPVRDTFIYPTCVSSGARRRLHCWPTEASGPLTVLYLLTYLLTPWCRVLLEQLTGLQLVKKFPAFHGTRRFITALTSVRHLSLSWASPIKSIYPHPISWRSVLILSTNLRLGLPIGLLTLPPDPVLSQLPRYNTSKYSW